MCSAFPAIDFPVYGLTPLWEGPRWLSHVHGELGHSARAVCLAHGRTPTATPQEQWVEVISTSVDCDIDAADDKGPSRGAAYAAAFALVNLTQPDDDLVAADFWDAALAHIEHVADRWESWQQVTWQVDGHDRTARVWRWAGAWAGFTGALGETRVSVIASGVDADGIAMSRVTDSEAYGFDLTRQVRYPEDLEASRLAALGPVDDETLSYGWPVHADHLSL